VSSPAYSNGRRFEVGDRVRCFIRTMSGGRRWMLGTIRSKRFDPVVDDECYGVDLDECGGARMDIGPNLLPLSAVDVLGDLVR
jgi:hypothetical protein